MKKLLLAGTMLCALASGAKADILGGVDLTLAGATPLTFVSNGATGNRLRTFLV